MHRALAKAEHRGKIKYKSFEDAQRVIIMIDQQLTLSFHGMNVYACSFCAKWHVGHDLNAPTYPLSPLLINEAPAQKQRRYRWIDVPYARRYIRERQQKHIKDVELELYELAQEFIMEESMNDD